MSEVVQTRMAPRGSADVERPVGLPGFRMVMFAAALPLAALAVGEKAGLPGPLAWSFGFVLITLAAGVAIWLSRTAIEPIFLGRARLLPPLSGGVLLGVLSGATVYHLLRPTASQDLAAAIIGSAAGLAAAHGLARLRRGSRLLLGEAPAGEDGAPSLIQGVIVACAGLLIAFAALPAARDATMLLTGWGPAVALTAVLAAPALAIAVGGLRGLAALAATLACIVVAGILLTLGLGLLHLGAPPLPGFAQPDTLLAIAGARTRLFQSDALPFIASFVPPEGIRGLVISGSFLGAALVAGLLGRAVTPGMPLARGRTLMSAILAQAALLFGLAAMAGYAVEAAGLQFVGASLQTPPAGLLEASRQGLAAYCGAKPDTLDELRAACGLAPRALGQLTIAQIRLAEPFLWTGAPVAFGAPSALAAPARLGPVAFPLLAATGGLWLAALGLGRSVLGRGRIAPGLASQRLALVRVAGILAAASLANMTLTWPGLVAGWQTAVLMAGLALGLDALHRRPGGAAADSNQRAATSLSKAAPRKTAQAA